MGHVHCPHHERVEGTHQSRGKPSRIPATVQYALLETAPFKFAKMLESIDQSTSDLLQLNT
ncbi:hypothetical protein POX_h09410 [Penicillium oxalicum]|uniref:Uncharacterized protein n=1 Tax=Penicillium oxalicum (strain 114-2 / CGMCC 5302) TaxID=933388 RepID=S7ZKE2_PENO1|nr:hypothetical protein POX_h09410 [Penicillium oxalicum]EPS31110.1 hypothetical protein PDE_06065 [Penicillium oxalicum 114-2]KAI2785652.1 hypothetical protein POX_h09410 [Penicillium oxalicum]